MSARTYGIRTLEDLQARCRVDDITGCWHWKLSMSCGAPHVCILVDGKIQSMRGRRAAVILAGREVPKGHLVFARSFCVSADCVNPAHCRVGTTKQSWEAKAASGQLKNIPSKVASARANAMRRRKLTDADAAEIRSSDQSVADLARRFNVGRNVISSIRRGIAYAPAGVSVFSWRPA